MAAALRPIVFAIMAVLLATAGVLAQNGAPANPSPPPADPAAAAGGPEQPIGFSHKMHAGTLQLDCAFCHQASKTGAALTIPQSAACMTCHQAIAADKPEIQRLATYAKNSEIIPWVRVYQLPSFANFSHKVHLEHGNTCQECHGQVAERDRIFREMDLSMAACVKCHTAKKASVDCSTCHSLDQ